jgi:hypothetical protein
VKRLLPPLRVSPLIALVAVMQPAHAGALYGTLLIGNSPAGGYSLHLECPGTSTTTVATDGHGSFSMLARAVGSCNMWVERGGSVGRKFVVFVSDNPMRFDFSIDSALNKR